MRDRVPSRVAISSIDEKEIEKNRCIIDARMSNVCRMCIVLALNPVASAASSIIPLALARAARLQSTSKYAIHAIKESSRSITDDLSRACGSSHARVYPIVRSLARSLARKSFLKGQYRLHIGKLDSSCHVSRRVNGPGTSSLTRATRNSLGAAESKRLARHERARGRPMKE